MTIDDMVDDYIVNHREALRQEMRSFKQERTLEDAIRRAALSLTRDGKRYQHEWRRQQRALDESVRRLDKCARELRTVSNFAAPLFTQAERMWNRKLAEALTQTIPNCAFVLPQDRAAQFYPRRHYRIRAHLSGLHRDLRDANLLIAIADGGDADSGTSSECGYANAIGQSVIGVRTDLRGGSRGLPCERSFCSAFPRVGTSTSKFWSVCIRAQPMPDPSFLSFCKSPAKN
jgi:hypothetical protein